MRKAFYEVQRLVDGQWVTSFRAANLGATYAYWDEIVSACPGDTMRMVGTFDGRSKMYASRWLGRQL